MEEETRYTKQDLETMRAWTLQRKIQVTQTRLIEWLGRYDWNVYVSFSGGKDSTVLADLAARVYQVFSCPKRQDPLRLVFVNTGLEYPEIQKFVQDFAEWLKAKYKIPVELEILHPSMTFPQVLSKYGYPTAEAVSKSEYTDGNFNVNSPWYWWLADAYASLSYLVRSVNSSGAMDWNGAFNGHIGVRPLCNLSSGILVSDRPDSDGAYTIIWNRAPSKPSSITVPSSVRGGESLSISWGASTDEDGNLSGYTLERHRLFGALDNLDGENAIVIAGATVKIFLADLELFHIDYPHI